jgi:hypothetical protein
MKVNSGYARMTSVLGSVILCIHLISCLWFLTAKLSDFSPDTWVIRINLQDESNTVQYITCVYWAVQTLTTVGFGDIPAVTIAEKIIAIGWMITGVGFFSFTIGNLSSIMANIDIKA